MFPLTIETDEGRELSKPAERRSHRSIIDAQIRHRDFRYIDQSDVVSAYRPRLNGHQSSGVAAEKTYAAGTGATPVVEFTPAEDVKKIESEPFSAPLPGPVFDTLSEFYRALDKTARQEAQRRYVRKQAWYRKFEGFRNSFAPAE